MVEETSRKPGPRQIIQYSLAYDDVVQAAHAVIQLQETGKPVYKVKNVSLNALCELYDAPVNPMKEQVLIMTLFLFFLSFPLTLLKNLVTKTYRF